MKKGNKTRLIISLIALALLPFSCIFSYSLYINSPENKVITITGSASQKNTYKVNFYIPNISNANKFDVKTIEVDENSNETLDNIMLNNNITYDHIYNNYEFSNSLYSESSFINEIDVNSIVSSSIDIYPKYTGYFVQGYFYDNFTNPSGDLIQLEYKENKIDDCNFISEKLSLGNFTNSLCYHAQIFSFNYGENLVLDNKVAVASYNNLITNSGIYKIGYNPLTNSSIFKRYIEVSLPKNSWLTSSDLVKIGLYSSNNQNLTCGKDYWLPKFDNTDESLVLANETFSTSISTYSFYLNPYQSYMYLVRLQNDKVSDNQYKVFNLSNKFNLDSIKYSYEKYSFGVSSAQESSWEYFDII